MLDLSLEGPVARLRLDRPERRNAIPVKGWGRLAASCAELEAQGARVLVVSGSADAFSAGADLSEFPALLDDPGAVTRFREAMRGGIEALAALPLATIALVEGPCFGAAVALVMACDIRIAATTARFAITPAKLGIAFPQQDVARLVALVGPGQASRLLFGSGTIDGTEAARIGLVEIASDDPGAAVHSLTASILENSAASVALLKRQVRAAAGVTGEDFDGAFDAAFGTSDFARRLAAFGAGR